MLKSSQEKREGWGSAVEWVLHVSKTSQAELLLPRTETAILPQTPLPLCQTQPCSLPPALLLLTTVCFLPPHPRKRPPSPQTKGSSKVTSIPGKGADPAPPAATAKSGKSSTLSRREELLKQLKAVEDAIARKRAKIPGKA